MRVIALFVLAVTALGCSGGSPAASAAPASAAPASAALASAPTTGSTVVAPPGMPVVIVADLPPEAAATLALIEAGGPFPYRQDGAAFQNREGLLPPAREGYYHEYTVPTPGEGDRGARRIVSGADGERYWTADHYDSFAWIDP